VCLSRLKPNPLESAFRRISNVVGFRKKLIGIGSREQVYAAVEQVIGLSAIPKSRRPVGVDCLAHAGTIFDIPPSVVNSRATHRGSSLAAETQVAESNILVKHAHCMTPSHGARFCVNLRDFVANSDHITH
jgi:hypothetical protein